MIQTFFIAVAVLLRIVSNPLANVFQKGLTKKGHHPLLINFFTYLLLSIACIFIIPQIPYQALSKTFWWYAVLAGIAGATGNGFLVKALQGGDLSVLGPINAYKAIVGIIVGIFLLSEWPNAWGLLGMAIIIYGSYFVLDTTEERFSVRLLKKKEIQFRIWAMILTAIEAVITKKIIILSSTSIAFVSWCWSGALFSFFLLLIYRLHWPTEVKKAHRTDVGRYLVLIVCIGTMQATTNYSFAHLPVGYALSLFQLSTIVSVLLGYRIFNEQNIRKKLLGSVIMISGSVVIILLK